MKQNDALKILKDWDKQGKYIFRKREFAKLFPNDNVKAIDEALLRLVKNDILVRACRGVYVYKEANSFDAYVIEHVGKALRPGQYNYVSLESMLSESGVISQIPIDRLTLMTTGRSGVYSTVFGVIEFTHTKRRVSNIVNSIKTIKSRPLRVATKETAWRELKRVGRNVEMVDLKSPSQIPIAYSRNNKVGKIALVTGASRGIGRA